MQPLRSHAVVDVALQSGTTPVDVVSQRAKALDRLRTGDVIFRLLTRAAAIAVLLILSGVILSLLIGSRFRLNTRIAYDLAPLLHFGFEKRGEFRRRAAHRLGAVELEALGHVRQSHDACDLRR